MPFGLYWGYIGVFRVILGLDRGYIVWNICITLAFGVHDSETFKSNPSLRGLGFRVF